MSSGFLASLKDGTTRCVMAPDGRVYKIRRINSLDMAKHRRVELMGMQAAQEELTRLQREMKAEADKYKLDHITDPDEKAKARANLEAWEETAQAKAIEKLMAHMTRDDKTTAMWLERAVAYCCAGIVGGHFWPGDGPDPLLDWIEENQAANYPDDAPIAYVGPVPEERCRIQPCRFVQKIEDEDMSQAGWIGDIDEATRQWLCEQVSDLSGSSVVKPFRRKTGHASVAGRDGEEVRDRPVPDPDVGPG